VTPGLGFRLILLDLLFLVPGLSGISFFAIEADGAGGGGLLLLLLVLGSSGSVMVGRVGRPSYTGDLVGWFERRGLGPSLSSESSMDLSRHVRLPPLPISLSLAAGNFPLAFFNSRGDELL